MIILISGASHTGKTVLAQKLLEKYKYPYLSLDLLKMGLIRSDNTALTPEDDDELVEYLWPITREMIKTAIENNQNLVVEGCYIPFDWKRGLEEKYMKEIQACWLIMSEEYIEKHFDTIKQYAGSVENRMDDSWCTKEFLLEENERNLELCTENDCKYILIDKKYQVDIEKEIQMPVSLV